MNIETKELMNFLHLVRSTTQTDISSSLTELYRFNIQRGFSRRAEELLSNVHTIHS